jgi:toxin secretion/phage lysis holin
MSGKIILTGLVSTITYFLGGWDMAIQVLTCFIVLDYLTGVMKAIIKKEVSSEIGMRGIFKKIGMYICIIVAVQLERLINQPGTIRNLVAYGFCINEGISILENLDVFGIDTSFLKKKFKKKGDDE